VPADPTRRTLNGLTAKAYRGDGQVLLAFDVDPELKDQLAGFAVECQPPGGSPYMLKNRLSFGKKVTADTTPAQRRWTDTDRAPLQTFRWVHFPKDVVRGPFTYRVTAMLFRPTGVARLVPGPEVDVSLDLMDDGFENFDVGFTRGYMSSQAYADRFDNAPFEPEHPTIAFDSAPFEKRWRWLGFHARRLVFDFLEEAIADPGLELDVFAYDLDEPDFVHALIRLGPRLRVFVDDSKSHVDAGSRELDARRLLEESAGADNVRTGHFARFQHNKAMIQRRRGKATKVLSGSANFSVRGLYVQSNNVFVFDDSQTADLYGQAFQQAWDDPHAFRDSKIASQWFERSRRGMPSFAVSFAPHSDPGVSLERVAAAVREANSSVLFAVMEVGSGTGVVMEELRRLPRRRELYAFGTTQRANGSLNVKASGRRATFVPFGYLRSKVPEPFRPEVSGGAGQVIHHKFVVVDFNDSDPIVFAGSSNLAAGGESENGDNLLVFSDRNVVSTYAVEAVRLLDHYRFRAAMKTATASKPLTLADRTSHWARKFFSSRDPRSLERQLFVR
jgi:phosphatidylserine/phosphatidylglycerophosphate/cardiolipin synthase-like enzyme